MYLCTLQVSSGLDRLAGVRAPGVGPLTFSWRIRENAEITWLVGIENNFQNKAGKHEAFRLLLACPATETGAKDTYADQYKGKGAGDQDFFVQQDRAFPVWFTLWALRLCIKHSWRACHPQEQWHI